ncbi:amino acid permease [Nonomuraea sp. NPDC000554]|uniref:APC family permease n=1 Tax=Nonomuraea sp. NPDC000554 TaxID=3154259 RepID=UPI00332F7CFA
MTGQTTGRLSTTQGTALLVGAVLGPGMLVLPHLAADAAGPASVLAWAGLLVLSVPVATTFATLGARYPDGGGVASFVALAFGRRASAVVGWWFYGTVPIGTLAGALVGGEYVAAALGAQAVGAVPGSLGTQAGSAVSGSLGAQAGGGASAVPAAQAGALVVAVVLLAAAFAANAAGLRTSGRLQLGLVLLLVAVLVVAVVSAAPHAEAAGFVPFAPYGAVGVANAAGVLLFAFVGWEAASHLSAEFADSRSLTRATVVTLAVITVLYLGVAVTSIGVGAAGTPVPLAAMLETGLGGVARPVTGGVAVLLTFGAINTYIAGASRLGAALARDGALPAWFAKGAAPSETPFRSLGLLAVVTGVVTALTLLWAVDLDTLMRATSACLAAVTAAGTAAAIRVLEGRARAVATAATVLSVVALVCCGPYLLVPVVLGAVALGSYRVSLRRASWRPSP